MRNDDETAAHDPHDTPEYHAFVEVAAKDCRCMGCGNCTVSKPCDAVLAGGMCDQVTCDCDEDREREEEDDDYDPNACPGCGGNCARACR